MIHQKPVEKTTKDRSGLFIILIVLLFSVLAEAQKRVPTDCKLDLSAAPNIQDIQLGFSPDTVEKVLGSKVVLTDSITTEFVYEDDKRNVLNKTMPVNVGAKKFIYSGSSKPRIEKLSGVQNLVLKFYDDSLYTIYIKYKKQDFEWQDINDFAFVLSDRFNLPKDAWWIPEPTRDRNEALLNCSGFTLFLQLKENGLFSILLEDKKVNGLVDAKIQKAIADEQQRVKDAIQDKKRAFKP